MAADNGALSIKTAKAGVWSVGARLLAKSIDFIALIFLARFLGPGDFGLVAMAMTLIFIVEAIFELPLGAALTRVPDPTPRMYETAFTLSSLRGIVIGTILVGVAWPLAHFYNEPRITPLIIALAFAPILRGLASPRLVQFAKQMDFRRQAVMDVLSKLIAGVASISVAGLTHSYWAIALGTILTPTVLMVGSYILAPMRLRLTLKDWPLFADMVGWNILSQILIALNWQIGRLTLPRFVDTVSFGRYAMASDLTSIPFQTLIAPLGFPLTVAFVTSNEKGDLKSTYLKASGAVFILMVPIFSFLGIVSKPLIDLFLGQKWEGAAILLTGLAVASIIEIPTQGMPSLAIALNQSRRITLRSLVQCLAIIPLTIIGVSIYGVYGAVVATGLVAFIVLLMSMLTVKFLISASLREQIGALTGPLLAAMISGVVLYLAAQFINGDSPVLLVLQIGVVGVLYVSVYVASIYLLALRSKSTAGAEHLIISIAQDTLAKIRKSGRNGE